jgi:diguanylate cyclase (GGDEF)-like protein
VLPLLVSVPTAVDAPLALAVVGLVAALAATVTAFRARDRALDELERERGRARTDALTGALNRHALEEALASEHARVSRGAKPTGVLFLDADRFRDVNNTYGYATGDALLVAVHDRLRSQLRASDSVYRWGGEEFVVIAPEVGDEASLAAGAERLRTLFADEPLEAGQHLLPVTVSIGAALLENGRDVSETLELAGCLAKRAKQWRNTALVQTAASPQEVGRTLTAT